VFLADLHCHTVLSGMDEIAGTPPPKYKAPRLYIWAEISRTSRGALYLGGGLYLVKRCGVLTHDCGVVKLRSYLPFIAISCWEKNVSFVQLPSPEIQLPIPLSLSQKGRPCMWNAVSTARGVLLFGRRGGYISRALSGQTDYWKKRAGIAVAAPPPNIPPGFSP